MLIEEAQSTHNLYNDLRGCKVNSLFGNTEVQVLNSILLVSTDYTVTVLMNFYPGIHSKTEQSPKLPVWIGQTLMKVWFAWTHWPVANRKVATGAHYNPGQLCVRFHSFSNIILQFSFLIGRHLKVESSPKIWKALFLVSSWIITMVGCTAKKIWDSSIFFFL